MTFSIFLGLILTNCILSAPVPADAKAQYVDSTKYGSAAIERIIRIEKDYTLICDLKDFPPIIGRHIPVRIRGLDNESTQFSPLLHQFMEKHLLASGSDPNDPVMLHKIQRGRTFCLIANVDIHGHDLGDLLVEKGFVNPILQVVAPDIPQKPELPASENKVVETKPIAAEPVETETVNLSFVASKSSKIFHRPDCSHAKRIAEANKIVFKTRKEAESTGRRPCKTCSP